MAVSEQLLTKGDGHGGTIFEPRGPGTFVNSVFCFLMDNLGRLQIGTGNYHLFGIPTNVVTGTIPVPLSQWAHVAYIRVSGVVYLFVNGVLNGSAAFTGDIGSPWFRTWSLGHNIDTPTDPPSDRLNLDGWIDDFCVSRSGVYSLTGFTPPNGPLTAIVSPTFNALTNADSYYDAGNVASYPGSGTVMTDLGSAVLPATLTPSVTFNTSPDAFEFNSANVDYITSIFFGSPSPIGRIPIGSDPFTMVCVFKGTGQASASVFSIGSYGTQPCRMNVNPRTGKLYAEMNGRDFGVDWPGAETAWTYMAITGGLFNPNPGNGTVNQIYVNGVRGANRVINVSNAYNIAVNSNEFFVAWASLPANAGEAFFGQIAIARIYDRELNPREIREDFDQVRGRFGL